MHSVFLLLAAALGTTSSTAVAHRAPLEINTPVPGARSFMLRLPFGTTKYAGLGQSDFAAAVPLPHATAVTAAVSGSQRQFAAAKWHFAAAVMLLAAAVELLPAANPRMSAALPDYKPAM
ncbi:hypothetical protein GGX14DRAFT_400855 [Mycena pura]|uniref:Uncharacterized protein n=1 Tax=Mycena pura TaxID=153505 RepID=A0AAD6V5C8_9AGAR|nr:hypothetical protein GGX14DRAFT_400855 [Mycena pura]